MPEGVKVASLYAEISADASKLRSGLAEAESALTGTGSKFSEMGSVGGAVIDELGSRLAQIALGGGLLALGAAAVKTTWDLANMGMESAQIESRFQAFSGGAVNAAANLQAMNDALGLAMTQDDKMEASSRIMSLGLANSAAEAANVARAAVMLGSIHTDAASRIDAFTQILVTGQTRGLAAYGISVGEVKARVKELEAANADLTTQQATSQAIMEIAAVKMSALEAAGYKAVTATQELAVAWADLKDQIAGFVAPVIEPVVRQVTTDIFKQGGEEGTQRLIADARIADLRNATAEVASAQANLDNMAPDATDANKLLAQSELDLANAHYARALAAQQAAVMEQASTNAVHGARNTYGLPIATEHTGLLEQFTPAPIRGTIAGSAADLAKKETDRKIQLAEESKRREAQLAEQNARKAQQDWESAVNAMKGAFVSALSSGPNQIQGLMPGGYKSPLEDPNGPYRDMRRLMDVAVNGPSSEWAAKLGVSQEYAKQVTGEFMQGYYGPEQMKFIDKTKLDAYVDMQRKAKASQEALGAEYAGLTGVTTADLISGRSGGATGPGAEQPITGGAGGGGVTNSVVVNVNGNAVSLAGNDPTGLGQTIGNAVLQALITAERQKPATNAKPGLPGNPGGGR